MFSKKLSGYVANKVKVGGVWEGGRKLLDVETLATTGVELPIIK